MSKPGKILFSCGWFVLFIALLARLFLGEWDQSIFALFGLGFIFISIALVKDRSFYKEILAMKTTKSGLSLGAVILLVMILLVAVNYIGNKENIKWDLTSQKLNSLSEQTVSVLKGLKEEVEFRGFFGPGEEDAQGKADFENISKMYQAESPKVKVFNFDPFKRKDLADKYKIHPGDILISLGDKQTTVTMASESAFTNAIVKLTRNTKKVYTFKGHGERDVEDTQNSGVSKFKKYLEDESYKVEPLNLGKTGKIPDDAAVLIILGPIYPYTDNEIKMVNDYLSNGGKVFIALDPGNKSNAAKIAQSMGIEFQNFYVQDFYGLMQMKSTNFAIGAIYAEHEITTKMRKAQTIFPLAGPLRKAPGAYTGIVIEDLVQTEMSAAAVRDIDDLESAAQMPKQNLILGMAAKGKISDKASREFNGVVIGDSDFLTNGAIDVMVGNRDFALNIMASLSNDSEMITIRPKLSQGTPMVLTSAENGGLVALVGLVPLCMFIFSFVAWWRRRGA